ncbi:hypothetical protein [Streptomyces sp. NPDC088847]|uniref:hypothetical protein n=1 Tax=Streptomyces sp. NPDC088847 TaxID=3365909 RepID=UPI003824F038
MATRTRSKRPAPTPKSTTIAQPAPTAPAVPDTVGEMDLRDRSADIIDAAREQAAALQTEAEARAAQTVATAHDRVTAMLADAQTRAAGITADADHDATVLREQADQAVAGATGDADRILAEARERAAAILTEARTQVADLTAQSAADHQLAREQVAELRRVLEADLADVAALVDRRRSEAGAILARAHEQAGHLEAAAQREVDQARERAEQLAATAAAAYDARRAEAEKLYADATAAADARRRDADQAVTAAHGEAERARAELREQLREMGEAFDKNAADKRAVLDTDLAQLRAACDEQRARLQREAATVTTQLREKAQQNADRIVADAQKKAQAVTERAQADEARARRLLDELKDAKRDASRWNGWQRRVSRAGWRTAPWIALLAGIGLAASGEYELAHMVGIHPFVAPLLPVSIDVYCVTAFRTKRDIPAALTLMASANVIYHLSEQAHLVPDGQPAPWWLTTFVVLIFVAVIWRVHSLMHDVSTDDHGGTTDTPVRTDVRTATAARTNGTTPARTSPSGTHSYAPPAGTGPVRTASGTAGTQPVHGTAHRAAPATVNAGATSTYTGRTGGVQAPSGAASRTSTEHSGRTSGAAYSGGSRTSTVTARTTVSGDTTAARTGTATPARTDEELLPLVRQLPRDGAGFVTVSRVRTDLSVNQPRAVRLLKEAGLLRPADADKYLA